eukprot:scaffold112267_cov21-Phaeocystis_antarctica.AAC.1
MPTHGRLRLAQLLEQPLPRLLGRGAPTVGRATQLALEQHVAALVAQRHVCHLHLRGRTCVSWGAVR